MTPPTGHTLYLTLPGDRATRATVIYLQPKAERWRPQSATVHILCREWLEPYWHAATYHTDTQSFAGQFMPLRYELRGNDYFFAGSFELERNELPAE